ncbi:DUF3891 family protein [Salicibibacter cibarius]|uniref:DUF3891 family protein n=1 Tax=Salicibibacter cibarius TaxID=2743000 RepID=A0A7T6Z3J0_9BACI|nr:DUF3891 family protein [Salicibibacter cibarius]QQK76062.1 DUF3891 family protein [Salicibibacter cibarius]
MIVRDAGKHLACIHQDEHARLSGALFRQWGDPLLEQKGWKESLHTAIAEHDRAWISLDTHPIWNEAEGRPYDFTDYPEREKIAAYQTGINETEMMDEWAGLLVSRHLHSFFARINTDAAEAFKAEEQGRWERLRRAEESEDEKTALSILKMCDELSLFACMNQPGARKEDEVTWFQNGFSMHFGFLNHQTVIPSWKNDEEIELTPAPLRAEVQFPLKLRRVAKESIWEHGWKSAYDRTPVSTQVVTYLVK